MFFFFIQVLNFSPFHEHYIVLMKCVCAHSDVGVQMMFKWICILNMLLIYVLYFRNIHLWGECVHNLMSVWDSDIMCQTNKKLKIPYKNVETKKNGRNEYETAMGGLYIVVYLWFSAIWCIFQTSISVKLFFFSFIFHAMIIDRDQHKTKIFYQSVRILDRTSSNYTILIYG